MRTHQQRVEKIKAKALDDVSRDIITPKRYYEIMADIDKLAARDLTGKERDEVLADANGQCEYCVNMLANVVDHAIPVWAGGTSDRENLKAACRLCNTDKLHMTVDEWREARLAEGRSWPPNWWVEIRESMGRVDPDDPRHKALAALAGDGEDAGLKVKMAVALGEVLGERAAEKIVEHLGDADGS